MDVGSSVTFTCKNSAHTVGTTMENTHDLTCLANGTFPSGWPECAVKCLVPEPQEGYAAANNQGQPVKVGVEVKFEFTFINDLYGNQFWLCSLQANRDSTLHLCHDMIRFFNI